MTIQNLVFLVATLLVLVGTVAQALRLRRQTGHSPVVLTGGDDALGFSTWLFRLLVVLIILNVVAIGFWPDRHRVLLGRLPLVDTEWVATAGLALWIVGGAIILAAQWQMGRSWRIGIDQAEKAALVDKGIFGVSRNPIYLGMVTGLSGLFLIAPEPLSAAILVATWVSLSYQIRMEEEFLQGSIGEAYADYRTRVRRWL